MSRKWVMLLAIKQNHFDFLLAEIRALAEIFDIPKCEFSPERAKYARKHFRFNFTESAEITEEKLRKFCARSVSVHGLYEIWDEAENYEKLQKSLKNATNSPEREKYYNSTFAFDIEMIHRMKMKMPERLEKFERFTDYLPMAGKIQLVNPE